MAKARLVVSDQNSAELEAMRRSYNSLLLVLENIASEVDATTLTAAQGFTALLSALSTGVDSSTTNSHVPTGRMVVGIRPTPTHPLHRDRKSVV